MKIAFFRIQQKETKSDIVKDDLLKVVAEIEMAKNRFSNTEDEDLIDSAIFEMNSLFSIYRSLLKKAKNVNIEDVDLPAV